MPELNEFFNLTDPEIVKKIVSEIEGRQNLDRKEEDYSSYQIYSGNQLQFVEQKLQELYPESFKVMVKSNVNVLGKVTDKKAKVYKDSPVRLVNGKKNDNLEEIYSKGKFNRSFALLDTIYNRSKCTLAWVQNDPLFPTKFRVVPLNQFTFDVVIDNDTFELLMVILSYPGTDVTAINRDVRSDNANQLIAENPNDSAEGSRAYAMWTKDHHINIVVSGGDKTTTKIDYMIDPNNKEMENPLGKLNFVWVTTNPDIPEYPVPSSLPGESININCQNSIRLTAASRQLGQLVLKYPEGSAINVVHTGFKVAMKLPQSKKDDPKIETTAEYIVPNSDLAGMGDTINDYAASVLSDNGLEGASLAGKNVNFTSALERMIANASVDEIRSENISTYRCVEEDVFQIIKAYDQLNGTRLFGKDDTFSITYPEPELMVSQRERIEIVEKKKALGVLEEFEVLMELNPGMTPQDAKSKLKRLKKEKDARMKDILSNPLDGNQDDDSDDEDQDDDDQNQG